MLLYVPHTDNCKSAISLCTVYGIHVEGSYLYRLVSTGRISMSISEIVRKSVFKKCLVLLSPFFYYSNLFQRSETSGDREMMGQDTPRDIQRSASYSGVASEKDLSVPLSSTSDSI